MSINDVRTKYEKQLMNLPNVTGVGQGEKEGKEVIIVFVKQKVPEAALRPEEIVPQRLEGEESQEAHYQGVRSLLEKGQRSIAGTDSCML
jgi:hypothetical protein